MANIMEILKQYDESVKAKAKPIETINWDTVSHHVHKEESVNPNLTFKDDLKVPTDESIPERQIKKFINSADRKESGDGLNEFFPEKLVEAPEPEAETSVKKAYRAALRQQRAYQTLAG